MTCSQCQGIEQEFNQKAAAKQLTSYHKNGPSKSTRLLINTLLGFGVESSTLLDIGGGIGTIQHALLNNGLDRSTSVDASSAYADVARKEAHNQGLSERSEYIHGDFISLASEVESADIVTLDKVICCYDDMHALVSASAAKAKKYYGLIFPNDTWWVKAAFKTVNLFFAITGNPFRSFAHSTAQVEEILKANDFKRNYYSRSGFLGFWQVVVYSRI